MHGRGEAVTPLRDLPRLWLVIAKPNYGVSTGEAYAALDAPILGDRFAMNRGQAWRGFAEVVCSAVRSGDFPRIAGSLWNDFEGPVFETHPDLRDLKMRLVDLGASGALLAGSGSAVFGVFGHRTLAESAWETLTAAGWETWRVPSLTREESLTP